LETEFGSRDFVVSFEMCLMSRALIIHIVTIARTHSDVWPLTVKFERRPECSAGVTGA